MTLIPDAALASGFKRDTAGVHDSRTVMLAELRQLLSVCPAAAGLDNYRAAVVTENVLLKKTVATRQNTFRRLRELYALDPGAVLFRALRDLWDADATAQPLLALLCAVARDPVLRTSAELILATPPDDPVTPQALANTIAERFPGRFNDRLAELIGRNLASSWQQSGHLVGRLHKVRTLAACRPVSAAYALFLGYLCGERGNGLFSTHWCRLLDAPPYAVQEMAMTAARLGLLEFRRAGDVIDVAFRHLLRNT